MLELLTSDNSIDYMWYEIGLALRVHDNILKGLQRQGEAKSNVLKLNEVIDNWIITKSSSVTWDTLITAIEGPFVNNVQKANEIRKYLNIGKYRGRVTSYYKSFCSLQLQLPFCF